MSTITMDLNGGGPSPKRGDRLSSPRHTYYVLHARVVKRRDPNAAPRFKLFVAKLHELENSTRFQLLQSAIRRGGSHLFEFAFYPRKKKAVSFEQFMRR